MLGSASQKPWHPVTLILTLSCKFSSLITFSKDSIKFIEPRACPHVPDETMRTGFLSDILFCI